jgi:hypothetical protein
LKNCHRLNFVWKWRGNGYKKEKVNICKLGGCLCLTTVSICSRLCWVITVLEWNSLKAKKFCKSVEKVQALLILLVITVRGELEASKSLPDFKESYIVAFEIMEPELLGLFCWILTGNYMFILLQKGVK